MSATSTSDRVFTFSWEEEIMNSPTKCVLLACGSYNPVTNMHLRMFEIARDALNRTNRFSVVKGIISPVSDGYSKKDLLPAKQRCEMLRRALKTSNWISLDTWECEQPQWSETAKVLRYHKAKLEKDYNTKTKPTPTKKRRKDLHNEQINSNEDEVDNNNLKNEVLKRENIQLRLLCGADLLESFGTPGLWDENDIEEIVGKFGLVCITREGSDPRKFIYESDVLTKYQENIFIVTEWISNDISSTKIRRSLRRGESVKYLVQDVVIDYIKEHNLYGVQDNKYINDIIPSPVLDNDMTLEPAPAQPPPKQIPEYEEVPRSPKRINEDPYDGPPSPKSPRHVPCMGPDLGMLVRRVRNVRIVAYAPETCV